VEKILLLLHTDANGSLPKAALEAVASAGSLACSLNEPAWAVGFVGGDVQAAANAIAGCGAGRFLGVAGEEFAASRYSTDAAAAEALCRTADASLILAPATSRWRRALPGVAQRLKGRLDTHVVAISAEEGTLAVQRWYYRQRIEAVLTRSARPWMILLDPGCGKPWAGEQAQASVEMAPVEVPGALRRTTDVGLEAPQTDEQTIRPEADLLFVAGAGWTKKQKDGHVHAEEAGGLILDFVRKTKSAATGKNHTWSAGASSTNAAP